MVKFMATIHRRFIFSALTIILAANVCANITLAQSNKDRRLSESRKYVAEIPAPELFKKLSRSVVVVEVLDTEGTLLARGSGVIVATNQIVTNRHVVDAGSIWQIRQGDKKWRAFLTYVDPDHDLAELHVDSLDAKPVMFRSSCTLSVGERVYALGSPKGLELTFTDGLISGLRDYEHGNVIQTSAAISPGSSGGGLFDGQGQLVGVTSFGLIESQNLNFALPTEWIHDLVLERRSESKQDSRSEVEAALRQASIASGNIQTMVYERRLLNDVNYRLPHSGKAISWLLTSAVIECIKDKDSPKCSDNWPAWEVASLEMLQLRLEIQGAQASRDSLEEGFLGAARDAWKSLQIVYCKEKPSQLYTDLDDEIRSCSSPR